MKLNYFSNVVLFFFSACRHNCFFSVYYLSASTHDQDVFSFYSEERLCNGFEEVLARYREIVPHLKLAGINFIDSPVILKKIITRPNIRRCVHKTGPTSFAPIIEMAITIVEQSAGQYHVLLIIADGQVLFYFIFHV